MANIEAKTAILLDGVGIRTQGAGGIDESDGEIAGLPLDRGIEEGNQSLTESLVRIGAGDGKEMCALGAE